MNIKILHFLLIFGMVVLGIVAVDSKIQHEGNIKAEEINDIERAVPLSDAITINAEREILHYQKESFWNDKEFSEIIGSRKQFEKEETDSFKEKLEKYDLRVFNMEYEFNEKKKSTTLKCDLEGAMYSTHSYDFHWLLRNLPFDLYQFKKLEKELNYDGKVNDVPMRIRLIFPYTVAHCHEHVWPR